MINIKTDDEIRKIQEELKSKGVKYCMGTYVDIHGVPKGKVVPLSHLHHMAHGSELYTGYAVDGLGQQPNDDEIASVPDLDHIIQLPWQPGQHGKLRPAYRRKRPHSERAGHQFGG